MAQDDARDLLRRHNLRSTPQRRAILAAFRGAPAEHLSAEEVLARAASTVPEIDVEQPQAQPAVEVVVA
jgi:Fe2+ or Zn2+ uptake regulation protein